MGQMIDCAITGNEIEDGEKVRIILLTPNKEKVNEHPIYSNNLLAYRMSRHTPVGFPIACVYEEDTCITSVVKDDNALAIEKEYGLTIERIAEIIQQDFGIYESYGLLIHHFAEKISLFESYNVVKPLIDFGFKDVDGFYVLEGYENFRFKFNEKSSDLTSYIGSKLVSSEYVVNPLASALDLIYRNTGDLLGIHPDKRKLAIELHNMKAIYIQEEVYQSIKDM